MVCKQDFKSFLFQLKASLKVIFNLCPPTKIDCSRMFFSINDVILNECSSFTYLGHVISNDCKDDLDIKRQYKSLYAKGNSLTSAFPHASTGVKSLIFKSHCSSLYTCQLWSCFLQSSMKKLEVAYHGTFKMMLYLYTIDF